jgi:predicted LPLAT superfamily acyltransferase
MSDAARWEQISEAGSQWTLDAMRWILRHLGRRLTLVVAGFTSAFFVLRRGEARRASWRYLERVAATPEGRAALGDSGSRLKFVLRHFYEFCLSIYDRMVVWSGALDSMEFEHDGSGELFELAAKGEGALLIGAHIGSLDMMGFVAREHELKVNVVAFQKNAERINAFFESLGAENVRMIQLEPGSVRAAFEVRACIERGESVSIMADRVPPGTAERSASVSFLGRPARFPLGPFLLAGVLGCPVYLALCVRTGDMSYTTVMRPIASATKVPRKDRDQWARELLARYVALIEAICQRYPFQWFNFFDFWQEESG